MTVITLVAGDAGVRVPAEAHHDRHRGSRRQVSARKRSDMASLRLEHVVKRFADTTVIHGVDLDVADGEFVVFVGPSGCGKSTLLRMISGLEPVTDGRASCIDGKRVNDVSAARARPRDGVPVVCALSAHDACARTSRSVSRTCARRAAEIDAQGAGRGASMLRLDALLDRRPTQLSGGQRQRVAIGRAIVREPTIFLFDEPLSNLDAELRVAMRAEIMALHQRLGTTMIYVTHDQVEAMTMADKIVVLRAGRVEQIGTPLELYNHPRNRFVAGFIGSPQMNFLPARLVSAQRRSRADRDRWPRSRRCRRRLRSIPHAPANARRCRRHPARARDARSARNGIGDRNERDDRAARAARRRELPLLQAAATGSRSPCRRPAR